LALRFLDPEIEWITAGPWQLEGQDGASTAARRHSKQSRSFSQSFARRIRGLDVPVIRLHDLRHTAASLVLQSGANVKTVSERLGHASTAFTMDVYAASIPALEEETAAKVAALLD
jgi:integrase